MEDCGCTLDGVKCRRCLGEIVSVIAKHPPIPGTCEKCHQRQATEMRYGGTAIVMGTAWWCLPCYGEIMGRSPQISNPRPSDTWIDGSKVYKIPVVYIAGPFRAASYWEQEQNVRNAEKLALEVWALRCAAICPHTNTRFFQGALPDHVWLDGDLAIVKKCDAVLMTTDWQRSVGAVKEAEMASLWGIPVFYTLEELREWLKTSSQLV